MRQVQPTPLFNMAQAELIKQTNDKCLVMGRDAADLATRGVDAKRVAALKAQAAAFAALPTDGELDAAKQEATNRKAETHSQAVTEMQVIMGIVGTVNDARTPGYKMFGSAGLDSASDAVLYVGLLRVVRVGQTRLATYAAKGLTSALLDTLATSAAEFLVRMGAQEDAESLRGHAADGRVLAGNALYTELMDICAVGKALYAQTDARKYQDYVVNDAPASTAPPAPPQA